MNTNRHLLSKIQPRGEIISVSNNAARQTFDPHNNQPIFEFSQKIIRNRYV